MLNGRFFFDVMKWVDNRKVVTKSFLKKTETKAKAVSSVFSEDQTLGDGVPHLSEMLLLRKSIFGLFRPKLNSSEYNARCEITMSSMTNVNDLYAEKLSPGQYCNQFFQCLQFTRFNRVMCVLPSLGTTH